jgi:hypothetical protein
MHLLRFGDLIQCKRNVPFTKKKFDENRYMERFCSILKRYVQILKLKNLMKLRHRHKIKCKSTSYKSEYLVQLFSVYMDIRNENFNRFFSQIKLPAYPLNNLQIYPKNKSK